MNAKWDMKQQNFNLGRHSLNFEFKIKLDIKKKERVMIIEGHYWMVKWIKVIIVKNWVDIRTKWK